MRSSVVLFLAVSFAMFGSGHLLLCHSCPGGTNDACEAQKECALGEDSCFKLTSGEITYLGCITYDNCNAETLALRHPQVSNFKFDCCTSDLCNAKKKGFLQRIKDWFN